MPDHCNTHVTSSTFYLRQDHCVTFICFVPYPPNPHRLSSLAVLLYTIDLYLVYVFMRRGKYYGNLLKRDAVALQGFAELCSRLSPRTMSNLSSSATSSPTLVESTPHSSVPSPQMNSLSLTDPITISDEDKKEAARIKTEANKAFTSYGIRILIPSLLHCDILVSRPQLYRRSQTLLGCDREKS